MKRLFFIILLLFPFLTFAGSISGTFDAPTQTEDGEDLKQSDIGGFKVYYGTRSGDYIRELTLLPTDRSYTITGLITGVIYYSVMTAFGVNGQESAFSNESEKTAEISGAAWLGKFGKPLNYVISGPESTP